LKDCGRFWLSPEGADIDGWRLDVAHEVSPDFWREFATACNDAKPDCALLGELMHGDYNTHVGPGLLDSGTNYQLSKALWSSLNDHNYWELQHSFQRDEDMYGNLTMLNFLGNHDQCRVHSRLTDAREHYKLAAASLLLARGVPCVYYGDEVAEQGAPGGADGDLAMRRPLNLAQALQRPEAVEAVKSTAELMWLRRGHSALRDGDSQQIPLAHSNGQLSFARKSGDAIAVVAMNNESSPARVNLPVAQKCGAGDGATFVEPLAGNQEHRVSGGELVVELPPNGFRVFTLGQ
jgi:glycosidase